MTATYRTHDVLSFALFGPNATFETPEVAKKFMTEFIRLQPDLSDKGQGVVMLLGLTRPLTIFILAPTYQYLR